MERGFFITLEGLDGSGKTTQLKMLVQALKERGANVVSTCEPGGTMLGRRVREVILDEDAQVSPLAELLLFAADRAQHVQTLIRPALAQNKIVVSDRYADATKAYQGAGRGFDQDLINKLIKIATDDLQPDLTLFFDLPVEDSLERTTKRHALGETKNRLDRETADFHGRVRNAYLAIAAHEPNRFRIVDAAKPPNEIHNQVMEIINQVLQ